MNILAFRTLHGPNVYSHQPMVTMRLDLGDLAGIESRGIPGFVDRLLAALPGLREHHCGRGRPGGFVERLREGTYFGHVVEHVALELSEAAGIPVNRGKTVSAGPPGVYVVAVAFTSARAMQHLLRIAVDLVHALVAGRPFDTAPGVEEARRLAAKHALGPSTRAIVEAAARRGIPWSRLDEGSLIRLGHGCRSRRIEATTTDGTSMIGVDLAGNKAATKRLLAEAALPVPEGCVVSTRDEAAGCLTRLAPPLVVKPLNGNQGRGVSLNLTTPEQMGEAFDLAVGISPDVVVEQMYSGLDYRIVVVNGRMVAAAQRIPAHVRGDGVHTIRELIDLANHDPRRGEGHEKPLTRISADPVVFALLKRHGRAVDDVPRQGEMVLLRESANLSTGGMARDVTEQVHRSVRLLCERAARVVGLDVCGIDLVVPDIAKPLDGTGGIVEVNASPGIRMHHHPSEGRPRDVGGAIVDMLFPSGGGRIPIAAVTGTNGKTTVTRMIRHVIAATGRTVGMTTTDGIWIGDDEVARGDMAGPQSARLVLGDTSVEVAVLETARGGIMHGGLGYDWSDVGVLTNVRPDHIGQDGIEQLEDLLWVKRLVAERVREGGTLVLNAEDPLLAALPDCERLMAVPRRVVFFALDAANDVTERHARHGGTAFVAHRGWVEERQGRMRQPIAPIAAFPATLKGTAAFQVANVLAAVAACRAMGVDRTEVAQALATFRLDQHSHGRLNLFAVGPGHVLVDYGHNPAAIEAVCRMVSAWGATRLTHVLAVPGDRSNALIADAARALLCASHRVIVREDDDRRGRRPGEVANLIAAVLRQERPDLPVRIVLDEIEAVASAVADMREGEVVVAFSERWDEVTDWLTRRGGRPVAVRDAGHPAMRETAPPAA
jgi:cyanophycin synthetase